MGRHPADHPGPFALVDELDTPVLRDDDVHHLERVLRLRTGDALVLGDGAGHWRPARYAPRPDVTGPIEHSPPAAPPIGVAFALVKGGKPELVVQKLTELGIDVVVPFRAARSVVRWDDDKAARAGERLRAVARGAAMQCHRPWLPAIEDVTDLDRLLDRSGVALAERTGAPVNLQHPFVLVGPEGGWAPEELEAAARRAVPSVSVARHVLRAETAALAIGGVLAALRDGLVAPASSRA